MISRRKLLVIAAAILAVVATIAVVATLANPKKEVAIQSVENTTKQQPGSLSITNIDDYSTRIDTSYNDSIRTTLRDYLIEAGTDPKRNISGMIRDNSYSTNTNEYGTAISFLVDFPSLKRTYKVLYSNDTSGYKAVNVSCPEATEQIYPVNNCEETTNE